MNPFYLGLNFISKKNMSCYIICPQVKDVTWVLRSKPPNGHWLIKCCPINGLVCSGSLKANTAQGILFSRLARWQNMTKDNQTLLSGKALFSCYCIHFFGFWCVQLSIHIKILPADLQNCKSTVIFLSLCASVTAQYFHDNLQLAAESKAVVASRGVGAR